MWWRELLDGHRHRDEDPLFHWQRLLATPDGDLEHPALVKKPKRASRLRFAGRPDREALVPVLIRAHMEWWIMEKRGEQHVPQAGRVRESHLTLAKAG